jgi:hypothetical protein
VWTGRKWWAAQCTRSPGNHSHVISYPHQTSFFLPFPYIPLIYSSSLLFDPSSSTSWTGLLLVAAPHIWLIHLFLGRPRLLFPVGLYGSMYRGKRLWSIRLMWLNQLSLYLLIVLLRLFTFNVFLIASLACSLILYPLLLSSLHFFLLSFHIRFLFLFYLRFSHL